MSEEHVKTEHKPTQKTEEVPVIFFRGITVFIDELCLFIPDEILTSCIDGLQTLIDYDVILSWLISSVNCIAVSKSPAPSVPIYSAAKGGTNPVSL